VTAADLGHLRVLSKHRVEALNDGIYFVRQVDGKLLWINVVQLLLASLLPFSSSLVGEHPGFFTGQAFYAGNMAALALATIWQLDYLENHAELCDPPVPRYVAKAARFRCWSLVAVAALAVLLAAFDPRIGTAAFMLMIVLSRIGRRIEAREAGKLAHLSPDRPFP
jgi:uncharacterized membrane protein